MVIKTCLFTELCCGQTQTERVYSPLDLAVVVEHLHRVLSAVLEVGQQVIKTWRGVVRHHESTIEDVNSLALDESFDSWSEGRVEFQKHLKEA